MGTMHPILDRPKVPGGSHFDTLDHHGCNATYPTQCKWHVRGLGNRVSAAPVPTLSFVEDQHVED